jgi:DNA-binding GntR family transcriptional regulator
MTTITNTNTMSNTKREPLLSDADLGYVKDTHTPEQVRDIYEAARAKDAELIQQLVDALHRFDPSGLFETSEVPLAAAKAAGFKPSQP